MNVRIHSTFPKMNVRIHSRFLKKGGGDHHIGSSDRLRLDGFDMVTSPCPRQAPCPAKMSLGPSASGLGPGGARASGSLALGISPKASGLALHQCTGPQVHWTPGGGGWSQTLEKAGWLAGSLSFLYIHISIYPYIQKSRYPDIHISR